MKHISLDMRVEAIASCSGNISSLLFCLSYPFSYSTFLPPNVLLAYLLSPLHLSSLTSLSFFLPYPSTLIISFPYPLIPSLSFLLPTIILVLFSYPALVPISLLFPSLIPLPLSLFSPCYFSYPVSLLLFLLP